MRTYGKLQGDAPGPDGGRDVEQGETDPVSPGLRAILAFAERVRGSGTREAGTGGPEGRGPWLEMGEAAATGQAREAQGAPDGVSRRALGPTGNCSHGFTVRPGIGERSPRPGTTLGARHGAGTADDHSDCSGCSDCGRSTGPDSAESTDSDDSSEGIDRAELARRRAVRRRRDRRRWREACRAVVVVARVAGSCQARAKARDRAERAIAEHCRALARCFLDLRAVSSLTLLGILLLAAAVMGGGWWGTTTLSAEIVEGAAAGARTASVTATCPAEFCERIQWAMDATIGDEMRHHPSLIPADGVDIADGLACVCEPERRLSPYGALKPLILSSWAGAGARTRAAWMTRRFETSQVESCWATPRDYPGRLQTRDAVTASNFLARARYLYEDPRRVHRLAGTPPLDTREAEGIPRLCAVIWSRNTLSHWATRTTRIACNRRYTPGSNPNVCALFVEDGTGLCTNLLWKEDTEVAVGGVCARATEAAVDTKTIRDAFDHWRRETEWEGTVASNCSHTERDADCFWISIGGRWDWSRDVTAGLSPAPGQAAGAGHDTAGPSD